MGGIFIQVGILVHRSIFQLLKMTEFEYEGVKSSLFHVVSIIDSQALVYINSQSLSKF
jgi:hypothetical protein